MVAVKNFLVIWYRHLSLAAGKWWRHKHADEAAALAFYSLISLVPILIIGVSVASIFVDEETATRILLEETDRVAGGTVRGYFAQLLSMDIQWVGSGVSPVVGLSLLFFSATKLLAELRSSLGKVFGAPKESGRSAALSGLAGRMISILLLCFLGVLMASAVVFETVMSVISNSFDNSPLLEKLLMIVSQVLSFAALAFLAAMTMRWLPVRPPKFKEAMIGGAVSGILLVVLKIALTQFLNHTDIGSFYGSALTLVLVLFWIYFAMQLFLFGAEISAQLTNTRRDEIKVSGETSEEV